MYHLNEKQALRAMIYFTDQFADRAGDDLLTLMGDISLRRDGSTFDPAAWGDWLVCVKRVVGEDAGTSIEHPTSVGARPQIGEAKLFILRALLGEVTPELRAVSISVDGPGVKGRFFFDAALTDGMRELVDDAESEVIADYGGLTEVAFEPEFLSTDESLTLGEDDHWVFVRRESPSN